VLVRQVPDNLRRPGKRRVGEGTDIRDVVVVSVRDQDIIRRLDIFRRQLRLGIAEKGIDEKAGLVKLNVPRRVAMPG